MTTTSTRKNSNPSGITALIVERLLAGVPREHILEEIKATRPQAKTNLLCIGWVASHLRTSGSLEALKQHKLAKAYNEHKVAAGL